jgi:hypothetical protein
MDFLTEQNEAAKNFFHSLLEPTNAVYFITALLVLVLAGSLVSMLSRSVMMIFIIGAIILAIINFHMYLPLPGAIHADLHILKNRIGL